ncbi:DUF1707 domain-containing protein [Nonomuraea sp. NPDC059023]|uniref:DUF1707 SHOCT-like domain-containing protein n=1 Tax=unclassified Nonomuraea TaxID=2593643 RepID=UPI0036C30523
MPLSEAERDQAVQRLQHAYAEGHLDSAEMEVRLEQALTARSPSTLATALAELPDERVELISTGGRIRRSGAWRVPRSLRIIGEYGGANLDLSAADIRHAAIEIDIQLAYGSVLLTLPKRASVDYDRVRLTWGSATHRPPRNPGPSTLHVQVSGELGYGRLKIRHR